MNRIIRTSHRVVNNEMRFLQHLHHEPTDGESTLEYGYPINTASIVRAPLLYGAATSAYLNPPTTERKRRAALAMMSPWEPDLFPGVNDDKT